jgi:hypothetical protein
MYSMIGLVDGEHRGRCKYPCNPDAQARWEAHRAHRAKSRLIQKRQQQRLFRNDTTAKARFSLFKQRMTPEKDRLRRAIAAQQYTARATARVQSTGKKLEPRISLAFRDAEVAAASEAYELSNKQMAADVDVDVDADADEAVDADVDVDEAADAAVTARPVSTKRKFEEIMEGHWKALGIWPVKYTFI